MSHAFKQERPMEPYSMFVRSTWKPAEQDLWEMIEQYPWALLINNGQHGPYATNLPLLLDRREDKPVLVGHLALGNEHARVLQEDPLPALAMFQGPASYVTASWYPNRDMPSTYYYTAIHCYGRVRIQDEAALDQSLEVLTRRMESRFPDGWKTAEVPRYDITRRLKFILGFEIEVTRIEGKFKLGQDEPKKDAMAVGHKLAQSEDTAQRELSRLVLKYNSERADS